MPHSDTAFDEKASSKPIIALVAVTLLRRNECPLPSSAWGHALKSTTAASNHARTNPAPKLTLDQRVASPDRKLEGLLNRRPTMNESNPPSSLRPRRPAWNKGKMPGPKPPLRPGHVWAIRAKLQLEKRTRDLAMFNLAIDSKLRGCDLVALRVDDVAPNGYAVDRATIRQPMPRSKTIKRCI